MGTDSSDLQNLRAVHYVLALTAAAGLFCLFVAIVYPVEGTPSKSLPLAGVLSGAVAAAFAYAWPKPPWVWAALVSAGFWGFLLAVFVTFLVNGSVELWPVVDALVIVGLATGVAACARLLPRPSG